MAQNEHIYAICGRQEVVDDVISGENEESFCEYVHLNLWVVLWVVNSAVFKKIEVSYLCNVQTMVGPLEPIFWVKKQMSNDSKGK